MWSVPPWYVERVCLSCTFYILFIISENSIFIFSSDKFTQNFNRISESASWLHSIPNTWRWSTDCAGSFISPYFKMEKIVILNLHVMDIWCKTLWTVELKNFVGCVPCLHWNCCVLLFWFVDNAEESRENPCKAGYVLWFLYNFGGKKYRLHNMLK